MSAVRQGPSLSARLPGQPLRGQDGGCWNDLMTRFYTTFPYPGRPLWVLPDTRRMLTAHAGFAALLQQGDVVWARRVLNQQIGGSAFSRPSPLASQVLHAASLQTPKRRLLLAGCGTDEPVLCGALHPDAWIDAVDLSLRSLRRARFKWMLYRSLHPRHWFPRAWGGPAGRLRWIQGDATAWLEGQQERPTASRGPWAGYDHAVCYGVLHHQQDPQRMLRALVATLAPGGTLRLMVYSRSGRALERCSQRVFRADSLAVERVPSPFLLRLKALRLRLWLFVRRLRGNRSQRLMYAERGGVARVADALLHPCDPGLDPAQVVAWAAAFGCRLIYCRAKCVDQGWLVGIEEPLKTWQQIEACERRGDVLSNVELIFAKVP